METFVWLAVAHTLKGEWRCVKMEDGEECVFTEIPLIMLTLCADSWDFHHQVRASSVKWDNSFETVIVAGLG